MIEVATNLFRGSKADSFEAITYRKVGAVINLETEFRELILGGANDELLLCLKNGVRMFDFALSGCFPPEKKVVNAVLDVCHSRLSGPVLVHCRHGHERTGFIIAVYRMRYCGWNIDQAVAEWRGMGCHWLWLKMWRCALERVR